MKRNQNRFAQGFFLGVVSMLIVLGCIFAGMFIAQRENRNKTITGKTERKLEELKSMIDYYYLDSVKMEDLESGVYKGLLSGLNDPYSVYYTKEEYQEILEDTTGNYVGIGVLISQDAETGVITIVRCFEGSPAKEVGIMDGDVLYKVEDKEVTGEPVDKVVARIKGSKKDKIHLTVYRGKTSEYKDFDVERRNVSVPTVEAKMLDKEKGIGYLAVSLGYFRTLFSCSGKSTSSEVPEDVQKKMGMSEGLVRYSVGLDNDMEMTFEKIEESLKELGFIK